MTVPAVQGKYELSVIGLRLTDPDLPLTEFTDLCWTLGQMHEAVRFAIGDAIIQGEALYGEDSYQSFESFGVSEEGMKEYVRVALAVPRSMRRKDLSWSHHRAVASLRREDGLHDRAAQKAALKMASEQALSHHAFRDVLRNGAEPRELGVCRCCGRRYEGA